MRLEIAKVEAKLRNEDFLARAPDDVIAEHEERREAFQERLGKLEPRALAAGAGLNPLGRRSKCCFPRNIENRSAGRTAIFGRCTPRLRHKRLAV